MPNARIRPLLIIAFAALASTALLLPAALVSADETQADRVGKIIERTKATRKTYALYNWNKMDHPGLPHIEEWSAEFNAETLHRVETPRDRVIANCQLLTGTWRSLPSGDVRTGSAVANTACGINTNNLFERTEWLGRVRTHFGIADRVRLTDHELIKTYDISDDGVILRTVFQSKEPDHPIVLLCEAMAVDPELPDRRMFDEQSLDKSYVPERYKHPLQIG